MLQKSQFDNEVRINNAANGFLTVSIISGLLFEDDTKISSPNPVVIYRFEGTISLQAARAAAQS